MTQSSLSLLCIVTDNVDVCRWSESFICGPSSRDSGVSGVGFVAMHGDLAWSVVS